MFANISFCTEEVPVEVTSSSESHLKFMDSVSTVIYRNYTPTMCNRVYPKAFEFSIRS